MRDALKVREDMVDDIRRGNKGSKGALAELKALRSPSGLGREADAEVAFAAADVGRRLVAAEKAEEAEEFFREAEKAFEKLIKVTPDTESVEKARLLAELATIRVRYLNAAAAGKANIDAAIKLQPDDVRLQRVRDRLGSGNGAVFTEIPPRMMGQVEEKRK